MDLNVAIGGPQGGGIDTSSNMINRAFAEAGYNVFGVREYHSNIKGNEGFPDEEEIQEAGNRTSGNPSK